jgi:hypothetical protein
MLREEYRKNYEGEFVIVSTKWTNGRKEQVREWIPNPVDNHHISGRAVIVGEGSSRNRFKLYHLENHKGGLLGKKKLQTYAVNRVVNELTPDFLVTVDKSILDEHVANKVTEKLPVYTTTSNCIAYPGECFMVPYNVKLVAEATATYLAAFDGHQEIFLIGCDAPIAEPAREKFSSQMKIVFDTYPRVKFYVVDETPMVPKSWRNCRNVAVWDYRTFISECDIG